METEEYVRKLHDVADAIVDPKPGWPRRLLRRYWKHFLFVALCLIAPFGLGLVVLFVVCVAWLINWSGEMQAMNEREFERWKKGGGK